ncbi:MAG TPA: hypothetical protein VNZ45_02595 [Bacteroidia bacterium]|jgi:hypothetical protein|nr:hypothetical protein [Bacteroidia bacterium]
METITLRDGYSKKPEYKTFRKLVDIAEMIEHCSKHSYIWFISIDGTARRAKVNGKVRTWKRNTNRVEVPVKYGLYEYGTFGVSDLGKIIIPVESE